MRLPSLPDLLDHLDTLHFEGTPGDWIVSQDQEPDRIGAGGPPSGYSTPERPLVAGVNAAGVPVRVSASDLRLIAALQAAYPRLAAAIRVRLAPSPPGEAEAQQLAALDPASLCTDQVQTLHEHLRQTVARLAEARFEHHLRAEEALIEVTQARTEAQTKMAECEQARAELLQAQAQLAAHATLLLAATSHLPSVHLSVSNEGQTRMAAIRAGVEAGREPSWLAWCTECGTLCGVHRRPPLAAQARACSECGSVERRISRQNPALSNPGYGQDLQFVLAYVDALEQALGIRSPGVPPSGSEEGVGGEGALPAGDAEPQEAVTVREALCAAVNLYVARYPLLAESVRRVQDQFSCTGPLTLDPSEYLFLLALVRTRTAAHLGVTPDGQTYVTLGATDAEALATGAKQFTAKRAVDALALVLISLDWGEEAPLTSDPAPAGLDSVSS